MARIAAELVESPDDGGDPELVFAVAHVSELLRRFGG
jgi:hypothetical protein